MTDPTWTMKPLVDLCKRSDGIRCGPFGTQLKKDEFRKAGVPLWGIKHVNAKFRFATDEFVEAATAGRLAQYDLIPGDLVMTRKGTIGNCAVYPEAFPLGIMHSDLLRLRLDLGEADPSFFVHQLLHSSDVHRQLASISGGAVMPGINVGRLKKLMVRVPPFTEQKRIAGILDAADALRAKRREALAQLDTLLQSTFLDIFGDPVTNPKGWMVTCVGDVTQMGTGSTPSRNHKNYFGGSIPWVKSTEVDWGTVTATSECLSSDGVRAARLKLYPKGSIVLALYGQGTTRGKCAVLGIDATINQACCTLVPRDPNSTPYLFQFLKYSYHRLRGESRGGNQENLNMRIVRAFAVPVPPLDVQQRYATIAESVEKQKTRQRSHLAELDTLFASLQSHAFRGDL